MKSRNYINRKMYERKLVINLAGSTNYVHNIDTEMTNSKKGTKMKKQKATEKKNE